MSDDWDAEDFEPTVVPVVLTKGSKWEGEDEDEDIKDSWEDEEEEKKDEEKKEGVAVSTKPKAKKLAEKIAEKERQRQLDLEKRQAEEEAAMTPEERTAEKLRRQQIIEEADLRVAMDTFGIVEKSNTLLDQFNPNTKEEFDEFCEALTEKISSYRAKEEYAAFVSDLVKNISLHLSSFDLKNLKSTLENLCLEKAKLEKGDKSKKPGKGKGKAKLHVETDSARMNQYSAYGAMDYDYDNFM